MSAPAIPVAEFPRPLVADSGFSPLTIVNAAMKGLASLKLTVALFVAGIFIVYVGTVAQQEADIWQVVHDYFHAWVMWVDVNLLFPKVFFPFMPHIPLPPLPGPGGKIIGVLMAVNLLAAHGWRFTIQGKGLRLALGLIVSLIGLTIGVLVIWAGHNAEGFQAKPPFSWDLFWVAFLGATTLLWIVAAAAYGFYGVQGVAARIREGGIPWVEVAMLRMLAIPLLGAGGLVAWGYLAAVRPSDEALRIVWQLVQGGLAGLVMLVGCILVFRKRGGMVLLHLGIGLLMFNELWVSMDNRERQVFMQEGQTVNYLRDIRTIELAIVDRAGNQTDDHVVVPRNILEANLRRNQRLLKDAKPLVYIENELLPARVAVLSYFKNADVRDLKPGEKPLATKGRGLQETVVELPVAKGTDSDSGVDMAAAYVRFADKSGKDLGTYFLSQLASEQKYSERFAEKLDAGGKTYDLFLRFKREYRPFTLTLADVRKDDYVASDTPRNYSSDVRVLDTDAGVDQKVHIKMNDPLRYRGETFYQSGYHALPGGEATTLQVVHNRGWMIPYVACMVVVIGLVAHFLMTVTRFVGRRVAEEKAAGDVLVAEVAEEPEVPLKGGRRKAARQAAGQNRFDWSLYGLPLLVTGLFFAVVGGYCRPQQPDPKGVNFVGFGRLPVAQDGRVKPLDTLARNSLRALSLRETAKTDSGEKVSAVEWLLEVICRTDKSYSLKVLRIDNVEVLKVFGLEPRVGFLYSVDEVRPKMDAFLAQLAAMTKAEAEGKSSKETRSVVQRKLIELHERLQLYIMLTQAFSIPALPEPDQLQDPRVKEAFRRELEMQEEELTRLKAPRTAPVKPEPGQPPESAWQLYPSALRFGGSPAITAFEEMKSAYRKGDVRDFNNALAGYEAELSTTPPPLYHAGKVGHEAYFNHVSPFFLGMPLYVLVFIIAIFGWLFRYRPLHWTAFTLLVLTFLLHTAALALRIYISGRPPVTNLYSSAIFIGWAAVLFGLGIEAIYRIGLGNIVASAAGFMTLLIAYLFFSGGDTITVLQAVLDTQFWLATHVVCITLGYASTYVAGLCGILYVTAGLATPQLNAESRKDLGRMIYGITCFAILFSFFGTVLGGLWADDSWGRFWGWDPKENGALIIVLWNALMLHARWDKLVGDRGLAVLALGGNIVTSWSWFGVNQLGIGLHSYGFTEAVVIFLWVVVLVNLALIVAGCLPTQWWWSYRAEQPTRGSLLKTI